MRLRIISNPTKLNIFIQLCVNLYILSRFGNVPLLKYHYKIGSPLLSKEIFICKSLAERIFCSIFAKAFRR